MAPPWWAQALGLQGGVACVPCARQAQTFLREHPSQPPLRCITITDENKRSRILYERDHTRVNFDTSANALIEGLITYE